MPEIKGKVVTANEVAEFYKYYPAVWFLLEVLKTGTEGKAELMKVTDYNKNKDVLRDSLLEELADLNNKYIFVYADPAGKCEI